MKKIIHSNSMQIILISLLTSVFIISCNVSTHSINEEELIFLSYFHGTYKLSQSGSDLLNNQYFLTPPSPTYSTKNIFDADNLGFMAIYSGQFVTSFQLQSVLDNTISTGIFKIILPETDDSGSLINKNRYLKIALDSNTNLIFSSQYALTAESAQSLICDTLFAVRFN